jgi:hypothetical protein
LSSCRFNRFSPNRQPSLGQRTDTLGARYAFDGFLPAVRAVALPVLATWKAVLLEAHPHSAISLYHEHNGKIIPDHSTLPDEAVLGPQFTQDLVLRDDRDNSIGPGGKCLHFVPPSPKVDRNQDRNHRQRRTKLGGDIPSLGVEHRERIKEPLDERIVSGVQKDAGPNTAGLQTHPGPKEVDCGDRDGEEL